MTRAKYSKFTKGCKDAKPWLFIRIPSFSIPGFRHFQVSYILKYQKTFVKSFPLLWGYFRKNPPKKLKKNFFYGILSFVTSKTNILR